MARSSKKGPFVDAKLMGKVTVQKQQGTKSPIKTWARASQIPPDFVGYTFLVHNGKTFKEVYITEAMVGHRLGEFSPTRTFHGHGRMVKRVLSKT